MDQAHPILVDGYQEHLWKLRLRLLLERGRAGQLACSVCNLIGQLQTSLQLGTQPSGCTAHSKGRAVWAGLAPHLDFKEGRAKCGPATDDLEKANLSIFLRASSVLVEVGNDRLQRCRVRGGGRGEGGEMQGEGRGRETAWHLLCRGWWCAHLLPIIRTELADHVIGDELIEGRPGGGARGGATK